MSRAALLAITLAGPLAPALAAQNPSTHRLAGEEVAIYSLVGEVSVVPGTGSEVVVEVSRTGAAASRLSIEVTPFRGIPTLRVVFPEDEIVYPALGRHSRSTFRVRSDGTWGGPWNGRGDRDQRSREITVRGSGQGLEAAANLKVSVPAGQRISIFLGAGQIVATNLAGTVSLDAMSGDVRVTGGSGTLDVDTGSGNISVSGTQGNLDLDTGSGDITVQGARGRLLKVDTGSGAVRGTDLRFDTANVDTGSGDIELDGLAGPSLELETGSGDVSLRLAANPDRLDVSTGSGSVRVRGLEGWNATLDLETGSGDFTVDFPMQLVRREQDRITGRIGEGRGRVTIETGSGDITITK